MASSINASTSGVGGLITTADNTGVLQLQTAGTTAVTIDTSQNTTLAGRLNTASSGIQFSDGSIQTAAASPYALKNRIINGAMVIDQRNAGASVTPTNGSYGLDRWTFAVTQASKFTAQQNAGSVTPPTGFSNYLGITSTSSYSITSGDIFYVSQRIEGFNTADLGFGTANAKTVTLSFWVRSSLTGTFGGALNNSAENRSYPFSYTISAANTWEYKTVTIAGDTTGTWLTTNGIGLIVAFGLGVGSTYTGTDGSWQAAQDFAPTGATSVVGTNGATFYITGVQLEQNTSATPFERRLYGQELINCQRYYWQGGNAMSGIFNGATTARFYIFFPVAMRAAPTITAIAAPVIINPTVSDAQTGSQTTNFGVAVASGLVTTLSASKIQFGGFSSGADGRACATQGNDPLAFNSEL